MMTKLKRIVGTLLLAMGVASAIYGAVGAWASESLVTVGAPDPKEGMSELRREASDYIPQVGYSRQDWIYWLAFFGGVALAYSGNSIRADPKRSVT